MFDMENINRQHQDILKLTQDISAFCTPDKVEEKAFSIAMLISQLSGRINVHLLAEDQHVYPSLMSHKDSRIQQISNRFAAEMGGLAQKFNDFKSRYAASAQIKADTAPFLYEAKFVLEAIQERIAPEERELYTLMK